MIKIMVVDDEPDVQSLFVQKFRKKIKSKEWSFIFCVNGKEALETLHKQPDIEMVLSDINMPVMDGLSFLAEMKKQNLAAKAVIISAYGDMKNIRTAMNRGAFDFITKPMNFDDVSSTIEKTLEHIQMMNKAKKDQNKLISLHKELEIAKTIQESILPSSDFVFPQCSISAKVIPAREVGGDFYDFFSIDQNRLGLVMADVAGKGIASAVFAVVNQILLKNLAASGLSPKKCIESVNKTVSKNNENCMFVTLFYGVLDLQKKTLTYVNAGHNSPYKIDTKKQVKKLPAPGDPPLDVLPDAEFQEHTVPILPEETLFLYTDGITEAQNKRKEFFGENRLQTVLSKKDCQSVEQIGSEVLKSVHSFAGEEEQSDDITYLICQYNTA